MTLEALWPQAMSRNLHIESGDDVTPTAKTKIVSSLLVAFTFLYVGAFFYFQDLVFGYYLDAASPRETTQPFILAYVFYLSFGLAVTGPTLLLYFMKWNIVLHSVLITLLVLLASIGLGPDLYETTMRPVVILHAALWGALYLLVAWKAKMLTA